MTGYVNEVWRLRHFWLALVRNDLRRRYRRSMIGLGWSLLQPIALTIIFCIVFSTLFHQRIRTFAPYLLSGLVFWEFFCGSIKQGCQCFIQGESYIRQHRAPLAIYALRVVLGVGIHFLMGLAVVLTFVWCVNGLGNLPALTSLLPTLALLLVFGCSVAVCVGMVNVLFQDTQHLVDVGLRMLFYLTPIMYPADMLTKRRFGWIVHFNPAVAFLEVLRRPILYGELPSLLAIAVVGVTVLSALVAAILCLRWAQDRIIFHL